MQCPTLFLICSSLSPPGAFFNISATSKLASLTAMWRAVSISLGKRSIERELFSKTTTPLSLPLSKCTPQPTHSKTLPLLHSIHYSSNHSHTQVKQWLVHTISVWVFTGHFFSMSKRAISAESWTAARCSPVIPLCPSSSSVPYTEAQKSTSAYPAR